ncbi:MAG: D-arabinono-1,4-lactone oxidase [Cyclobacteriaceae bacterium]
MKKRQFLKNASLLLGGNLVMPLVSCDSNMNDDAPRFNWAGNLAYSTQNLDAPIDRDNLRQLVQEHDRIKPLGTRHSFNRIADSKFRHLSLHQMSEDIEIERENLTVRLAGGVPYGILAQKLQEAGFALHNLASLPHISVAGACATGTHGSGDQNGNLSTAVRAMDIVTADGELVQLSEEDSDFKGAVVGLGALGIVTGISLSVLPTYSVRQHVYENLPLHQLQEHFEEIFSFGYSVSLFTDWQKERINQLWVKKRDLEIEENQEINESFFGATLAKNHLHPIKEISPVNCTEQMGIPGPWHERLPHFKMDFTPSSGEELQSEYFVPREHAVEAITALYAMGDEIFPHLFISEVRSIQSDGLWLSPAYGRDSIALHFTWKPDWENVKKVLPKIENTLNVFGLRPHWGKLFTLSHSHLKKQYERMDDFIGLMDKFDPKGKFHNEFLKNNILGKL